MSVLLCMVAYVLEITPNRCLAFSDPSPGCLGGIHKGRPADPDKPDKIGRREEGGGSEVFGRPFLKKSYSSFFRCFC